MAGRSDAGRLVWEDQEASGIEDRARGGNAPMATILWQMIPLL
jgi:hypothetical protein